ncbi:MAG: multicopper oxidase family protein [Crocosphaera sp.]
MNISRRKALQLALLTGGFITLPVVGKRLLTEIAFNPFEKFQLSFRVPPTLTPSFQDETTDYYQLITQKAKVEFFPGLKTEIWGYNGISPGPLIRQKAGRRSVVRVINQLGNDQDNRDIKTVTHLHGMSTQPQYDGYALDFVSTNYYKDYVYPNDVAATLWYHDHVADLTLRNVYMGLLGMYIVEDDYEKSLPLPKGEYDVPIILETKKLGNNGALIFNNSQVVPLLDQEITFINGVPWPKMKVANTKYRFRVLNATGNRFFQLMLSQEKDALTAGDIITVIGNDGGLIDHPIPLSFPDSLKMTMAERYEIIIDFSKYEIGSQLYLHNLGIKTNIDTDTPGNSILCFEVSEQESNNSKIPETLRLFETIDFNKNVRKREFIYEKSNGKWMINQQVWNPERIDTVVNPGEIEIWTLVNPQKGKLHPVHLHGVEGQIIDRNGKPPLPYERGWKDVFHLGSLDTVRIAIKFAKRNGEKLEGKYMVHCHHLQHEDNGMMSQYIIGKDSIDPIKTALPVHISSMPKLGDKPTL